MALQRGIFAESELMLVDESKNVVLASGGPMMEIVELRNHFIEWDAVCKWKDALGTHRAVFPVCSLRKPSRVSIEELLAANVPRV